MLDRLQTTATAPSWRCSDAPGLKQLQTRVDAGEPQADGTQSYGSCPLCRRDTRSGQSWPFSAGQACSVLFAAVSVACGLHGTYIASRMNTKHSLIAWRCPACLQTAAQDHATQVKRVTSDRLCRGTRCDARSATGPHSTHSPMRPLTCTCTHLVPDLLAHCELYGCCAAPTASRG
jgi:hypothetical protein